MPSIKYPLAILYLIRSFLLLMFALINVSKLPPRFVKPCIIPSRIKLIFIFSSLSFLKTMSLNLDKLINEKNIIVSDVNNIILILFSFCATNIRFKSHFD